MTAAATGKGDEEDGAAPVVLGSGLVALDVVVAGTAGEPAALVAGGTCGNVLTILSYLGWQSYPLSRLNGDRASVRLQRDLQRWNVRLDHARLDPPAATPMVVHRIHRDGDGLPFHTFSWTCPSCGARLPWYRPVHKAAAHAVASRMPAHSVFFFDRVSRGTLLLAEASARQGGVVVFEPSGFGDVKLFREALRLAHVLKYSRDRMGQLDEIGAIRGPLLEIETLGRWGLCYRTKLGDHVHQDWTKVDAFPTGTFRDAAGAGDWCTAGILDRIARGGFAGLQQLSRELLQDAISFGQALAVWNCAFEGARGGMYRMSPSTFRDQVERIIGGVRWDADADPPRHHPECSTAGPICPACPPSA